MTPAFRLLEFISRRSADEKRTPHISGLYVKTIAETPNCYSSGRGAMIPAGTWIQLDFGGEFGFYGIADIDGDLHRVRVELPHLSKIDWSEHLPASTDASRTPASASSLAAPVEGASKRDSSR